MKVGDKVLVDIDHVNGGYEAEITWIGKIFARIKKDDKEWNIVMSRLTSKDQMSDEEWNDRINSHYQWLNNK